MSDARQHLRAVPSTSPRLMAEREIAVRFTSISGLTAPLRKPPNSFGWVGPATLRFSEHGVLISARRATLLGLRQSQRFIPPAEIRDVYREANAVQVHLRGARKPYFRLWAEDAASAAQIVALLPTSHTVEFETAIHDREAAGAWRWPAVWAAALTAVACLLILGWVERYRSVTVRAPLAPPVAPAAAPGSAAARADALLAIADVDRFGPGIDALAREFLTAWEALLDGRVSQQKFAEELDQWLRPQWDDLEAKLGQVPAAPGSQHERADLELMGAITFWQLVVQTYAEDLRAQRFVDRPFRYLARAQWYQRRAERLRVELEQPPVPAAAAPQERH